ncbi:RagB/SusD family nutrient uptake outer membrane protein [Mucilaginibacter agri]|uniref:RagB/SusD family nutrient uptake outer membrane protein n=1 Tax=Mucilaginibacter agri TaxID=2695265 RepID=A0A966DTJ0_9SPHI|nr:RagB/SusD family nutrient uptake outer membrane protein [Mucilaginibacter agri]NCD68739.1 RagB/SusD family nutrient uptake outer membrane protein [Mucilaginibacter agri]
MTKKLYISALLAVSIFAGCKKSPLTTSDPAQYSANSYPASVSDLQSVLASCYSNLRDQNLFGFHLMPKALANATHTANSAYDGDAAWNEMTNTNLSITNQYSTEAYTSLYTGVKNCNVTLAAADKLSATALSANDKASVDYIRGQAYFLRAYYYFWLECLYGESYITSSGGGDKMGVPIYSSVPTDLASTQVARSSVKDVWALIESDLKQSATLLKGKNWTGNDVGRITEWAAKGLLGKAYVFTQDWTNAKTTLIDVINNSGKTLMPFAKYADAFDGNSANEFNEESLFELNVDADAKGNDYGIYGGKAANSTTINGLIWPAWALGGDGTEAAASALGYGNEVVHDKNITRFGYNIGYYNLVANPNFDSSKPASFTNPKQIMDPAYKAQALAVRANKTADPRLFVNTVQPWIDVVKPDGVTAYPASKPNFFAGQVNTYGFSFRKYSPVNFNINNNGPADAWNLYLLRLADVYLLYAEACKNSGDNANALEYINKVKRRAYNLPINGASAVDYTSLTAQTSAINDPVLGNNPLYYERFAELFNEGHWWFDVCRWRIGKSEATYYGTAINLHGAAPAWDDAKSYVWPIPLTEINSNSKIKQNPGY